MSNFTLPPLILTTLVAAGISHGVLVGTSPPANTTFEAILPLAPSLSGQANTAISLNSSKIQTNFSQTPTVKKFHTSNHQASSITIPPIASVKKIAPTRLPPQRTQPLAAFRPEANRTATTKPALSTPLSNPATFKPKATVNPTPEVAITTISDPSPAPKKTNHNLPNDNHYLIQLIGSPDNADIQRFLRLRKKNLSGHAPINKLSIQRDGTLWHLLLMGPYDGYRNAKDAFNKLPADVRKYEPWLRKSSSLPAKISAQTILFTTNDSNPITQ